MLHRHAPGARRAARAQVGRKVPKPHFDGFRLNDGPDTWVPLAQLLRRATKQCHDDGCRARHGTVLPPCEYRADQAVNRNLPAANKSSDISRPLQAAGGSPVSCRSRIRRQILRLQSTFRAIALGNGPLHRIRAANDKTFGLVGVEGLDRSRGRVVELPWKMRKVTTPSQAVTVAVCDRGGHRLAYSRPPSPESLKRACSRELFDGR
jgi:hypothetical protein